MYRPTIGVKNEEQRDANCMFNRFWSTLREIHRAVRGEFIYPDPEPVHMMVRYA